MPTKWAQQNYWNLSDSNAPPPAVPGRGGYPMWQASVVAPSLLGAIFAWWDVQYARVVWFIGFLRRVHRLDPERRTVLLRTLDTLEHPAYPTARVVVRETATTLGFTHPEAWKDLARHMKADNGRTENVYRHLRAMARLRELSPSTLSNPQQNFLTELAYQGFSVLGK